MLAPEAFAGASTAGYLDTATFGLPPDATAAALEQAVEDWRSARDWLRWEEDGEACRALFAGLVGARSRDVALLPAVSVAAGLVAASIGAGRGDNVVCYEREFHSALFPWLLLEREGVEVRLRPLDGLADGVDARTRLVAVSTVQSADGRVANLEALRDTGAGSRSQTSTSYYGPPPSLTPAARRLDTSLPWLLAAGARPSLELLASLGVERIAEHDHGLAWRFCSGLGIPETGSPIVQVQVARADAAVERLSAAGVTCSARAGALRFAFHLYNDEPDVDRALEAPAF